MIPATTKTLAVQMLAAYKRMSEHDASILWVQLDQEEKNRWLDVADAAEKRGAIRLWTS